MELFVGKYLYSDSSRGWRCSARYSAAFVDHRRGFVGERIWRRSVSRNYPRHSPATNSEPQSSRKRVWDDCWSRRDYPRCLLSRLSLDLRDKWSITRNWHYFLCLLRSDVFACYLYRNLVGRTFKFNPCIAGRLLMGNTWLVSDQKTKSKKLASKSAYFLLFLRRRGLLNILWSI